MALPARGWLRRFSRAEANHWYAVAATGDLDLAMREFRREYDDVAPQPVPEEGDDNER